MTRIPFTVFGRYQSHAINYEYKIYHLSKRLEGIYPLLRKTDVILRAILTLASVMFQAKRIETLTCKISPNFRHPTIVMSCWQVHIPVPVNTIDPLFMRRNISYRFARATKPNPSPRCTTEGSLTNPCIINTPFLRGPATITHLFNVYWYRRCRLESRSHRVIAALQPSRDKLMIPEV